MDRLRITQQRYSEVIGKIDALLAKAVDEDRAHTEEEKTELATLNTRKTELFGLVQSLERSQEEIREADRPGPAPRIEIIREEGEDQNGEYRPFRTFGEQLKLVQMAALGNRSPDERLLKLNKRAAAGLSEGVGQDGGFLVQTDFSSELLKKTFDVGVLMPRVRRFPLSPGSNGLKINVIDETSRVDGSRWGGVQAYWEEEAGTKTASKPKFGQLHFQLNKLIGLCHTTDELLADASALGSVIGQAFAEEFSFKIDDGIFRGVGGGQLLGVLNSPSLVSFTRTTTGTIKALDIMGMRARMWARSRLNSIWLINQDCEPKLHKLNYVGDGSKSDIAVYQPANGLAGLPYDTLYGRPVIPIEHCSTLGTVGDIMLVDLSEYGFIERGGMESATSIHVYFTTDQTSFRFVMRLAGMPLWKSAITPYKGTATQSPFVALAT